MKTPTATITVFVSVLLLGLYATHAGASESWTHYRGDRMHSGVFQSNAQGHPVHAFTQPFVHNQTWHDVYCPVIATDGTIYVVVDSPHGYTRIEAYNRAGQLLWRTENAYFSMLAYGNCPTLDPKEQYLYMVMRGLEDRIARVDLHTHTMDKSFQLPETSAYFDITMTDDSLVLPSRRGSIYHFNFDLTLRHVANVSAMSLVSVVNQTMFFLAHNPVSFQVWDLTAFAPLSIYVLPKTFTDPYQWDFASNIIVDSTNSTAYFILNAWLLAVDYRTGFDALKWSTQVTAKARWAYVDQTLSLVAGHFVGSVPSVNDAGDSVHMFFGCEPTQGVLAWNRTIAEDFSIFTPAATAVSSDLRVYYLAKRKNVPISSSMVLKVLNAHDGSPVSEIILDGFPADCTEYECKPNCNSIAVANGLLVATAQLIWGFKV